MVGKVKVISWIIMIVLAIVVAYTLRTKFQNMLQALKDIRAKRKEQKLLADLGIEQTVSAGNMSSLANELYQAVSWSWYNPNCNETGTQKVLMKLNTDADYNALALAFGVKDNYSMEMYIQSCLNASEKNLVNSNWSSKGMTKRI